VCGVSGVLDNQRHELFAQGLAQGKPASQAYVEAGYAFSEPNASRLTRNEKVVERVAELKARAAAGVQITVANITERLLKIAEKGEGSNDAPLLAVARASLMDAAKLNGLIIDKAEIKADVTSLTDEQLDAKLIALATQLGHGSPARVH
jgi:membrane-associated protease RseP (regulator of RpoE activity)